MFVAPVDRYPPAGQFEMQDRRMCLRFRPSTAWVQNTRADVEAPVVRGPWDLDLKMVVLLFERRGELESRPPTTYG